MISIRNYGKELDFSQRYWFVKIEQYYPVGFLDDVEATCDTLEELISLKRETSSYEDLIFWDNREFKEIGI